MSDRDDFKAAVTSMTPPSVYRETHAATVIAQHPDGTLDLVVDGDQIGALTRIPLRLGLPGAAVLVDDGARVRVSFMSGDPAACFAHGFELDAAGTQGVARVGDPIDCGTLAVAMAGVSPVLTYTPPGGTPGAPSASVKLVGIVAGGSKEVLLRGDD